MESKITHEQAEKALAKEFKKAIKNYEPQERKFPLDDSIRYVLTDEEQKRFDHQYDLNSDIYILTTDTTEVSVEYGENK